MVSIFNPEDKAAGDEFSLKCYKMLDLYDAGQIDRTQLVLKFLEIYITVVNKTVQRTNNIVVISAIQVLLKDMSYKDHEGRTVVNRAGREVLLTQAVEDLQRSVNFHHLYENKA